MPLLFTNLAEQPTEDVEIKLRTFIFEKLGIEHKLRLEMFIVSGRDTTIDRDR